MKTKKLLSILLSLCLIVTVFVPSMVMSTSAADISWVAKNMVYKISCAGDGKQRDFRFNVTKSATETTEVWYEFEYYLSNEAAWMVRGHTGNASGQYIDQTTNSNYLLPGRHTFKGKLTDFITGKGLYPMITSNKNTVASDLYIWNYKVYSIDNGVTTTHINYETGGGGGKYDDALTVTTMSPSEVPAVMGEDPETMTIVDIEGQTGNQNTYRTLQGLTAGTDYVISFDYYMQYNPACTARFWDVSSSHPAFPNLILENGLHSVSIPFTYVSGETVDIGFFISDPSSALELYVRNFKVVAVGEYYKNYWDTAKAWSKTDIVYDDDYDPEAFVEDTETVTYIDINVGNATAYKLLNVTKGATYTVSFKYCLKNEPENDSNTYLKFVDVTKNSTIKDTYLRNGSGSLSTDFYVPASGSRSDIALGFNANQTLSDFYLYDFKLVKKGTTTNLLEGKSWTYNAEKVVLEENVEISRDDLGLTPVLSLKNGTETESIMPVPYSATANIEVEYYLDADIDAKLYAGNTLLGTFEQGKSVLTVNNAFVPQSGLKFVLSSGTVADANLYIKGISVADKDGVVVTDKCSAIDNASSASYVGYNSVVDAVAPAVEGTYDAENNALVFTGAINATGITAVDGARDESGSANWKITIGGIEYDVKDFGMVVARTNMTTSIPETQLVYNSVNPFVRTVSAKNLTSVSESDAKFSVTVENILNGYQADFVAARTYVVATKNDTTYVIYSDAAYSNAFEDSSALASVYSAGLQTSSLDAQAEAKRVAVLNTADAVTPSSSTVYISHNGSDETGDGTKENPFRSASKIPLTARTVLFERGGIYRGGFDLKSFTTYGAYGEGAKPAIYGSAQNYADEALWTEHSDNVWKISLPNVTTDIGSVIFNDGKRLGYKILADATRISGGYEITTTASDKFFAQSKEYSFYHDVDNKVLYLYSSKGNPAASFTSIELAEGNVILTAPEYAMNIKIDNLAVKYGGAHGMNFLTGSRNITITNCEIGFIGGSLSSSSTEYVRFGNGIQFVNEYQSSVVDNCWIYQCYDAGYTFQNCDTKQSRTEEDMTLTNSLIEYCVYNIEIFSQTVEGNVRKDILIENNFLRMAGYGWGTVNRTGSNSSAVANISLLKPQINSPGIDCDNFVIRNNILDGSFRYLLTIQNPNGTNTAEGVCATGPIIMGNTYVQKASATKIPRSVGVTYEVGTVGGYAFYGKIYASTNLETMQASVKAFDLAPANVIFDK